MFCMMAWVPTWGGYFGLDVTRQMSAMHSLMEEFLRQGVALE